MALPQPVLHFLKERHVGGSELNSADDLFKLGILDSFSLVDFLTILEEHCDIKVPDSQVSSENFRTIDIIDQFVDKHRVPKE